MVESFTEDLPLNDGSVTITLMGGSPQLRPKQKSIRLHLCCKETQLGSIPIQQWWMDWRSVYGDRDVRDSNHQAIIDYYWGLCKGEFTVAEEDVQESYILAHLLPHARSKGSRRVLRDSILAPKRAGRNGAKPSVVDKSITEKELDNLLRESRGQEMDIVEFRNSTANAIGPPVYDDEVWECYKSLAEELLGEGRDVLEREGDRGIEVALDLWKRWMNSFVRRRGFKLEKQVLDILSYECRASVHRCYSAVWDHLIFYLAEKYKLNDEEVLFHRIWHLDQFSPLCEDANFHLFHGHIFGLHPAGADFMRTPTGRGLIGEWLLEPEPSSSPYRRLLYGLSVAVYAYSIRNDVYAALRKKQPVSFEDISGIEEEHSERKSVRKRTGKRDTDVS